MQRPRLVPVLVQELARPQQEQEPLLWLLREQEPLQQELAPLLRREPPLALREREQVLQEQALREQALRERALRERALAARALALRRER